MLGDGNVVTPVDGSSRSCGTHSTVPAAFRIRRLGDGIHDNWGVPVTGRAEAETAAASMSSRVGPLDEATWLTGSPSISSSRGRLTGPEGLGGGADSTMMLDAASARPADPITPAGVDTAAETDELRVSELASREGSSLGDGVVPGPLDGVAPGPLDGVVPGPVEASDDASAATSIGVATGATLGTLDRCRPMITEDVLGVTIEATDSVRPDM